MSILLTGGTGYIGSHTAVELLDNGFDIVIADNFSNSSAEVLDAIRKICGRSPVFYHCDVSDSASVERIFSENTIDAVIHFAGYKAVGESVSDPLMYYRNNLDTTLTLLEVMKKHGCRRFVFSSSATVYGAENPVPFSEDMPAGVCTNPYARTKYFIEEILKDIAVSDPEFSVVLLRYFNPLGAHESGLIGEKPNGVPNNLMPYVTQTASGIRERLNVYGNDYPTPDGTGVRDYIHITDLAAGHLCALNYTEKHSGAEVFNLGTGIGCSVFEVVRTFERVNSVRIPYVIAPRRDGDIAECYADTSKAEKLLGWKAKKNLEDMCRDSWNFQRSLPKV